MTSTLDTNQEHPLYPGDPRPHEDWCQVHEGPTLDQPDSTCYTRSYDFGDPCGLSLYATNRHGVGTATVYVDCPGPGLELTLAEAQGLAQGLYLAGESPRLAAALALTVTYVQTP